MLDTHYRTSAPKLHLRIKRARGGVRWMPRFVFAEENGRSNVRCVLPDPPQSMLIGVRIGVKERTREQFNSVAA